MLQYRMGTGEVIGGAVVSLDGKIPQNELDGSDESLNSVFEDDAKSEMRERVYDRKSDNRSPAGHGIKIFLNDLPDPNDIHRSLSTSCLPVAVDIDRYNSDRFVERADGQARFLRVDDNGGRGCSSAYGGSRERVYSSRSVSPRPARSHAQPECVVPYIVMDCPCSGSKTFYRSSSSLVAPRAEFQEEQMYRMQLAGERDSLDSGITNTASTSLGESVSNLHVFAASVPSSRKNSFSSTRTTTKKAKSTSEIIEDPVSHSLSTQSIESSGTFSTIGNEGLNDKNPMIFHLVVPRSMTNDVNPTHTIGSNQLSQLVDNGLIQNPNYMVSNETINAAKKMEGRTFQRLVDDNVQIPPSRQSSSTNDSSIIEPEMEVIQKNVFRKWLTVILSCVYATFLVMLGLVVYVADLTQAKAPLAEVRQAETFNICVTVIGFFWLIFLHIDIRRFINSAKRKRKEINKNDIDKAIPIEQLPAEVLKDVPHHYCFMSGRHSGSFYLKIGAAAFCFGHLIHYGLLLSRQIVYFTADDIFRDPCANYITLILDIILPLFSFYQLFMIFKYSNVVIRRYCEAARFALMHIIASNVCIWINTIIRETVESIQSKMAELAQSNISTTTSLPFDALSASTLTGLVSTEKGKVENQFLGFLKVRDICISKTILSAFTLQASPYLYPFTIEYSLLVAGVWFIIWFNVDNTDNCCQRGQLKDTCNMSRVDESGDFASNLVIHVDCHSANRGLFAGLFILLSTVVSIIIFFVAMMNKEYIQTGMIINTTSDIILLLTMSLSVLFAYKQTVKLDVNKHAVTFLDDILLFIALPCFFLYGIFNVVAGMKELAPLSIIASVLSVIQVILQTPFIIDGLRRCSNSQNLRYKKPGRELITFLVVCNLAMWILETFEIKSAEAHYDQFKFYGKYLWTILSHITLPLTLFYRFHSSVCLVDIWKSAYEPGD